jgi:predicted RNA binding protein YcfA (HicA-like mRNA interferase family)
VAGRLPSLKPREVKEAFELAGLEIVGQRGSHLIFKNPRTGRRVPLAMHNRDVKRGALADLIKQVRLTREEFLGVL